MADAAPKNETQTSAGKVKLVMHKSQSMASELTLDGVTLEKGGDPVEVEKSKAAKMLQRRDERGRKYVAEAS